MRIKLNDKIYEVEEGTTLAAFAETQGIRPQGVAIAIDYRVIPKSQWGNTQLTEDTELLLIQAVSGG